MNKLLFLFLSLLISINVYANEFYDLQLIAEPSVINPGANSRIIYKVTNVSGVTLTYSVRADLLPVGIVQDPSPQNPPTADLPVCSTKFSLANNASCYLYFMVISSQFEEDTISSAPELCAGSTCRPPEAEDYFTIVVTPNSVPISVSPDTPLVLAQGQEARWTVTNECPSNGGGICSTDPLEYTLGSLSVTVPGGLAGAFGAFDTLSCTNLSPQASCTVKATVNNNAPAGAEGTLVFVGSNSTAFTPGSDQDYVIIASSAGMLVPITSDISIDAPSISVCQTFQNNSFFDLINLNVLLGDGVNNVSVDNTQTTCTGTLSPNAQCDVCMIADEDAYGADIFEVLYTENGVQSVTNSYVRVASTTLLVNNAPTQSQPIKVIAGSPGTVTIYNTGNFYPILDNAEGVLFSITGGTVSDIEFDLNPCLPAPGNSCSTTYTSENSASILGSPNFVVYADNVDGGYASQAIRVQHNASVNLFGKHLQYQGIQINNSDNGNTLTMQVSTTLPSSRAYICQTNDVNCDYPSTCDVDAGNSGSIFPGQTCQVWIRSVNNGNLPLGPISGTVTVTLTGTGAPANPVTFNATQSVDVYAGGYFQKANGIGVGNIAKYNGHQWAPLGTGVGGVNSVVRALSVYLGDLYVGGDFNSAGGKTTPHLAAWNGQSWFPLINSSTNHQTYVNDNVYALFSAQNPNSDADKITNHGYPLYIGGKFTQLILNSSPSKLARRLAEFGGVNTGDVGHDVGKGILHQVSGDNSFVGVANSASTDVYVYSLLDFDSYLFTGGQFDTVYDPTDFSVFSPLYAKFDINSPNWLDNYGIPGSTSNSQGVYAMAAAKNSDTIALVGNFYYYQFPTLYRSVLLDKTGQATTPQFDTLGQGFNSSANSVVYGKNDSIYAGGTFVCDFLSINHMRHIARWDTGSQQWIQIGVGGLGSELPACNPLNGQSVQSLAYLQNGDYLIAGGIFPEQKNIAFIQFPNTLTSVWNILGGGVSSNNTAAVEAILITDSLTLN